MSLGVVIKGSEGVVLAADSRVTLTAQAVNQPPLHVNFDNATKVLSFSEPNDYVGAVTYGQALIGMRTASSFVPEFELGLKQDAEAANEKQPRLSVHDFAGKLSEFFPKSMAGDGERALPWAAHGFRGCRIRRRRRPWSSFSL